jgi:hypothetical protein
MASPAQLAANRRNAQKSSGPRTIEGKKRSSLNHLRHGMTAKTVVLPHENADNYNEMRTALIEDYAPANTQELMLVDQIAVGYWRTIRARRFETAMFDNHLRNKKRVHGKDQSPNDRDDEGCAVILQVTDPKDLQNYFRYDATISRDYYRAIATLEKMQAARRREEGRQERKAPDGDAEVPERTRVQSIGFVSRGAASQAAAGFQPAFLDGEAEALTTHQTPKTTQVNSIGFVS